MSAHSYAPADPIFCPLRSICRSAHAPLTCSDDTAFCVYVMYTCIGVFNTMSTSHCTSCWYICVVASTQRELALILGLSLGLGIPLLMLIIVNVLCICCPRCPLYRVCCRQKRELTPCDYLSFMWSVHLCQLTWSIKFKLVIIPTLIYLFIYVYLFVHLLLIRTTGTSLLTLNRIC